MALLALLAADVVLLQGAGAPAEPSYTAQLVNRLAAGLQGVFEDVKAVSRTLARAVPSDLLEVKHVPQQPGQPTSYLDVNLKLKDVDLQKFIAGVGLKLPLQIQGKLWLNVKAGIPLNSSGDLKSYRANGSATVKNLVVEGVRVDEVSARVDYANGVLKLETLQGRLGTGTFEGNGKLQAVPLGALSADLKLNAIPLARLEGLSAEAGEVQGAVSGNLQIAVPDGKLNDPTAWTGGGKLSAKEVGAAGWAASDLASTLRLGGGVLKLEDLQGTVGGGPVSAKAEVGLTGSYAYSANLSLQNWDLAAVERLIPKKLPVALAGRLTVLAKAEGTLKPFTVISTGKASATALRVDQFRLQDAGFSWKSNERGVQVENLRASLYGGEATGDAFVPLEAKAAGKVDLRVKDLDVGALTRDLPKLPVRVEGKASGELEGRLPPTAAGQSRQAEFNLNLNAPLLKVQNIPAQSLKATVKYANGVADYHVQGNSFGGTFDLDGKVAPGLGAPAPAAKQPALEGKLELRNIDLPSLLEALRGPNAASLALRGRGDLTFNIQKATLGGNVEGEGTISLSDLLWDNRPLGTVRLGGRVRLVNGRPEVVQLNGRVGEGPVELVVERGSLRLRLRSVPASLLVGPFLPAAGDVEGLLTLSLDGTVGTESLGEGTVQLQSGKVYGVEIGDARSSFLWSYGLNSGRLEVNGQDLSGQVARGRLTGRYAFNWNGFSAGTDGQLRFFDVDLQTLLKPYLGQTSLGSGLVSGRFDFNGRDMLSVNDLAGTLDATLGRAQAGSVPIIRQVSPLLAVSPSLTFNRGIVKARLARGVITLEKFSAEGGFLSVFAQGTITLQERLNLDVYANTNRVGLDPTRLRCLGLRIPPVGPIPLTVLLEANYFLSNRVVHLRVTGTVRNPNIRILPGATLTQEALRYFFYRFNLPLPSPGSSF